MQSSLASPPPVAEPVSDELRNLAHAFVGAMSRIYDPSVLQAEMATFIRKLPERLQRDAINSLGLHNPLYVPDPDYAARSWPEKLGQGNVVELTLRMKQAARDRNTHRILVAAPRKVASTFLTRVLNASLGTQEVSLAVPVSTLEAASALGANVREHEMDELAILRACYMANGFVSQQHTRCTPYLAAQLKLYKIKPILLKRNIFDTFVSLDDMYMDETQSRTSEAFYFDTLMPMRYRSMGADERMAFLIGVYLPWYAQFYLSWQKCEKFGLVRPLWLSYENDIKGPRESMAAKIAAYLGASVDAQKIVSVMDRESGVKSVRFNKGVNGRGATISEANRKTITDFLSLYSDEMSLAGIVED